MIRFLSQVNVVSVVLILLFVLPVIVGMFSAFSRERIRYSLSSLLDNIEFVAGILLSVYLTKRIFFEHDGSIFSKLYDIIPDKVKNIFYGQDILAYIVAVPVILLLVLLVIRLVTTPLYRHIIVPASEHLYTVINAMRPGFRKIVSALWQLPKAAALTLVFAFLLNFSMYYIYSPALADWTNKSGEYQFIYNNVMYPVLNSNIAKKIPVLVNDSFRRAVGNVLPRGVTPAAGGSDQKSPRGSIRIIEYFNGVTLDEAVKSNEKIDDTAKAIVGKETDDKKKARLIYKWVAGNIQYDYDKAEKIVNSPMNVTSGSIVAFETKKGICFDFASLYISMCRAVGVKVRLITGLGYSGVSWGDHAWNQVYAAAEKRWINVDTTFGSAGINYFDKRDFNVDHQSEEMQAEW